jgi:glycosyltransferase involved in cell wall biosynthesis
MNKGSKKIVIDARCIADEIDGIGRYSINLITKLVTIDSRHRYEILIQKDLDERVRQQLPAGPKYREISFRHIHPYTLLKLGPIVKNLNPDLFHSMHMMQPLNLNAPSIMTIHDTMWFKNSSYQAGPKVIRSLLGKLYFRSSVKMGVAKAAAIVTISDDARRDLLELWPILAAKTQRIYCGIDEKFYQAANNAKQPNLPENLGLTPQPFFLHITNAKPYKNTPRVIEAFSKKTGEIAEDLVIVGPESVFSSEVKARTESSETTHRVKFLGSVTDDILISLLTNARALIFPSLFEGFGLPAVEAMAAGCPVLTSHRGSLAEVVADAAYIVDPEDVDEIAHGMKELSQDGALRERLRNSGMQRAKLFDWREAALEILQLYEKLIK